MKKVVGFCVLALATILPAFSQTPEVKAKPAMYSYVANWDIPRAQWAEMKKSLASDDSLMKPNLGNGTLVGYGNDTTLAHRVDGASHDEWWSSMSMDGLLKVLDQASRAAEAPVYSTATKHWDNIYVSTYYNWKPGTYKDVYTHVGSYQLKATSPDDSMDEVASLMAPILEKLLADGTLIEYEIDTEVLHSGNPWKFSVVYVATNAAALDKVDVALRDSFKNNSLGNTGFDAMIDWASGTHYDDLAHGNMTYK